jgi:hypothetical protein
LDRSSRRKRQTRLSERRDSGKYIYISIDMFNRFSLVYINNVRTGFAAYAESIRAPHQLSRLVVDLHERKRIHSRGISRYEADGTDFIINVDCKSYIQSITVGHRVSYCQRFTFPRLREIRQSRITVDKRVNWTITIMSNYCRNYYPKINRKRQTSELPRFEFPSVAP